MFNTVLRIMNVDGVQWVETIPDTMYRSPSSRMIIVRTRGRKHGGRIVGSRFYCFILGTDGKHRKMRGKKGTIRYFNSPLDAAAEAALFYLKQEEDWAKRRLLSEIDELAVKARSLREEIAQLTKDRDALISGAGTESTSPKKDEGSEVHPTKVDTPFAELPAFLRRGASAIVSRYTN